MSALDGKRSAEIFVPPNSAGRKQNDANKNLAGCNGGALALDEKAPKNLIDALLRTATLFPNKKIIFVENGGGETSLTYAELLENAKKVLAGFRRQGLKPNDKLILQIESLREFVIALWGAILGGIIPVTTAIPPVFSPAHRLVKKLYHVWRLLDGPPILASEKLVSPLSDLAKSMAMVGAKIFSIQAAAQEPDDSIYQAKPGDVVFLQLTSGSTGAPKCIQETHRGIIAHILASQKINGYTSDDVTLNWLPFDHVVPILTFHFKDIFLGCEQIQAKTDLILADPPRWLDLIQSHRVTHSWSPNFGFKLVNDSLTRRAEKHWDLSSIKFFINAGEQVTMPVVREFLNALAPFGLAKNAMRPAFGMAEVCTCMTYAAQFDLKNGARRFLKSSLAGSLQEAEETAGTMEFVGLGPPMPGVEIRIVDPANQLLSEGVIGRLQIKGEVVTPGYLNNETANREAFVGDGWFNSGDLGFILRGELFLTGREKEMIIIRGAHFYCYEIEEVVSQISGVEPTFVGAGAVEDSRAGSEGLAIFFVPSENADTGKVISSIRARVAASTGISPFCIVPLEKKDFPKTTSGKIQRTQLKKILHADELNPADDKPNPSHEPSAAKSEWETPLSRIWQEVLQSPEVGREETFFELGGDSLRAFQILARVREQFEIELPLATLFDEAGTVAGMARWIETHGKTVALLALTPGARGEKLLLSFPQQRIWLLDQLEAGSALYVVSRGLWLEGPLDATTLERALNAIIERHEILRTIFALEDGLPVQKILPRLEIKLPLVDLRDRPEVERIERAKQLAAGETAQPFDLTAAPLLRAKLFCLAERKYLLTLAFHQIVVDGWSIDVFFEELAQLYGALAKGELISLPPLPIQYVDFAQWQRQSLDGGLVEKQLAYWKNQLSGALPILQLPADHARPVDDTHRGATEVLEIDPRLFEQIKIFTREENATLFMTLLAVYKILLSYYANQNDIIVGSPLAVRPRVEIEKLIGFFVSTIALRTKVAPELTFRELLGRVRKTALGAYANADIPFEKLVEELQPERNLTHTPIFQTWFGFIDHMPEFQMGEVRAVVKNLPQFAAQFDLAFFVVEKKSEALCLLEYKADLFEPDAIKKFLANYVLLLREVVARPEIPLGDLFEKIRAADCEWQSSSAQKFKPSAVAQPDLVAGHLNLPGETERRQWPVGFNDTKIVLPKSKSVLDLFEQQVARAPEQIAVRCGNRCLNYAELNLRAGAWARRLREAGVGPEVCVGLGVERSLEMVVGILAILKAGGAYVPLDPAYPAERLRFMLDETDAPVLLTQEKLQSQLPPHRAKVFYLDRPENFFDAGEKFDSGKINSDQLAYVIFTSGSTGKPKGVLVTHGNLLHSTAARLSYYGETLTSYLLVSSFAFDSSVAGIFWTLAAGGTLVLPAEGSQQDPLELVRLLAQNRISHFLSLPSLYNLMLQEAKPGQLAALRTVMVAGESCAKEIVARHRHLLPTATLFNEYGPTEGTVWSTVARLSTVQPLEKVTIGRPIPNTQIYLLDANFNPVPLGVAGEVFVGGAGVARGYLKRPELTAEKFIPDPFSDEPGARLYRTGDLACYLPDGNLEFLGRVDHQVKIRGYRIELEEIESILQQHAAVREALVCARDEAAGDKRLVAYVVFFPRQSAKISKLREFVAAKLPDYMIPAAFVFLEALPQTPNGKIDRNALPAPEQTRAEPQKNFVAPRTLVEEKLVAIWAEVLRVDQIGIHDNFFDLGGHSLLAIQVMARVREAFQVELSLRVLFEALTVAALAENILQQLLETSEDAEAKKILSEVS